MKKYYINKLRKNQIEKLLVRPAINFESTTIAVKTILKNVKKDGNKAVINYCKKFDGTEPKELKISESEINNAVKRVPANIKKALRIAAKNITKFHKAQLIPRQTIETCKGVTCFRENRGIEKVGLYIPGGTAPLPSTVLMLGIPAKLAGCKEIIICTPPGKTGKIPDIILYAAKLVGIDKIFCIGGAQAIAAMGYGTESVPKVYKIFGPGNQYVTRAKTIISTETDGPAIDIPAGPSEVLVIADKYAKASFVAADLLSQAEHGADSQVVIVCDNEKKVDEILKEVATQLKDLPRKKIATQALNNSFAIITPNIETAIEFSNSYAPEHLILNIKDSKKYTKKIVNAGSVFLGEYSCESAGDYASGTNHTLPTYGYAKAYSGVSMDSFLKKITFQYLNKEGIRSIGFAVETIAEAEDLFGHKNAMTLRRKFIT